MSVGEICNREVVVTGRETDIREAARLMREYHVGDLLIVERKDDENIPVGIVTDRDLVIEVLALDVALDVALEKLTVADLMLTELVTVPESADLWDALATMRSRGIRRMPVVNEQGGLEGILTIDDALDLLVEGLDDMVKLVRNEIQHETRRHH